MKNRRFLIFSMTVCLAAALFGCGKNSNLETTKSDISEIAETTLKTDGQETETATTEQESGTGKMTTIPEGTYTNMKVPAVFKETFLDRKEVITKKGSFSLTEYLCNDDFMNSFEDFDLTLSKYVCIDLDGDGTEEVIILLTTYDSDWVILHYENDKVYAYDYIPYRGIGNIKADGILTSFGGAGVWRYF